MTTDFMILGSDDEPQVHLCNGTALATERGEYYRQKNKANQDRVACGQKEIEGQMLRVYMVCDGLGGYGDHDGEKAAQAVCEALQKTVQDLQTFPTDIREQIVTPMLENAMNHFEELGMDSESGGTTFVLAVGTPQTLEIFHLGDSPAYVFDRQGNLLHRTQDHKPPGFTDRFKLTHYIHQIDPDFPLEEPDQLVVHKSDHQAGLILILASDGVSDNLMTSVEDRSSHPQLTALIQQFGSDPAQLCEALMKAAKERMALSGTPEGKQLDAKPDNSACLVALC